MEQLISQSINQTINTPFKHSGGRGLTEIFLMMKILHVVFHHYFTYTV
jgi:hypothetical protein